MDGLDGTGLQLDGLDWFKTFIGDQKLKKILYRQLEKVIFSAVTMRYRSKRKVCLEWLSLSVTGMEKIAQKQ